MKRSRENHSAPNGDSGTGSDGQSTEAGEDSFIGRWSRRKRDAAVDTTAPVTDDLTIRPDHLPEAGDISEEEPDDVSQPSIEPESESEPVLTDADMPDIETLNADSDFSPFFSKGVSKELRNLALKKLFFSGKFSARDGLDDYDDDFTKFEPLGDTVTSDMKFHARRKEKARLAALEEEERLRLQDEAADEEATSEEPVIANTDAQADELEVSSAEALQDDPVHSDSEPEPDNSGNSADTSVDSAEARALSSSDPQNV